MAAAAHIIATQGLGAPTATIAKAAGVANGSLFTYFETKAELFNQVYLDLKSEMASAAMEEFPEKAEVRRQLFHVWSNWMGWAMAYPDKRRALAQLLVSDEITPASRAAGHKPMLAIGQLLERSRAHGPLRKAPMGFVLALMNAMAETTMDFMIRDPAGAEAHSQAGFEALWRIVA